ncbi:hypothetical protein WN943_021430 [Citrus x changshan-huyou]
MDQTNSTQLTNNHPNNSSPHAAATSSCRHVQQPQILHHPHSNSPNLTTTLGFDNFRFLKFCDIARLLQYQKNIRGVDPAFDTDTV